MRTVILFYSFTGNNRPARRNTSRSRTELPRLSR